MTGETGFRDWRFIYKSLDGIHDCILEARKGLTPLGSLLEAQSKILELQNNAGSQISYTRKFKKKVKDSEGIPRYLPSVSKVVSRTSLPNVGETNLKKEIIVLTNLIHGARYVLEEDGFNSKVTSTLDTLSDKIKDLASEVLSKVDNTVLEGYLEKEAESIESSDNFENLSDAMKAAAQQLKTLQTTETEGNTDSRDVVHMAGILQRNTRDLQSMESHIKTATFDEDQSFTIVRGPIITDTRLDESRLKSSGIEYDVVYFPGVSYGFQNREAVPRMYILRNQILIAVQMNAGKRFQFKLKNKSFSKSLEQDDAKFTRLREDIVDMLQQKLHYPLVDITAEREGSNYITSKKFPKIRFIWVVKKSLYSRIGTFTGGHQVGLPF